MVLFLFHIFPFLLFFAFHFSSLSLFFISFFSFILFLSSSSSLSSSYGMLDNSSIAVSTYRVPVLTNNCLPRSEARPMFDCFGSAPLLWARCELTFLEVVGGWRLRLNDAGPHLVASGNASFAKNWYRIKHVWEKKMQFPGLGSELNPDPNPNLNLNLVETERQTTVLSKQNPFRSGGFFFVLAGCPSIPSLFFLSFRC